MAIRIFIDQGHNPSGVNAGAEGNGLREQDVTYNVGIYLANLLNDDPRFTARVSRPYSLRPYWVPAMLPVCRPV